MVLDPFSRHTSAVAPHLPGPAASGGDSALGQRVTLLAPLKEDWIWIFRNLCSSDLFEEWNLPVPRGNCGLVKYEKGGVTYMSALA